MTDKNDDIIQNLKDAGCNSDFIEKFINIPEYKQHSQILMLQRHREKVLENYHKYVKRLDCLDYLIYNIRKSAEK